MRRLQCSEFTMSQFVGAIFRMQFKPTGHIKCTENIGTMLWPFGPDDEHLRLTGSNAKVVWSGNLTNVVYVMVDAV